MTEDKEILDAFRQEGKEDYAFNLLVRRYSRDLYWQTCRTSARTAGSTPGSTG